VERVELDASNTNHIFIFFFFESFQEVSIVARGVASTTRRQTDQTISRRRTLEALLKQKKSENFRTLERFDCSESSVTPQFELPLGGGLGFFVKFVKHPHL